MISKTLNLCVVGLGIAGKIHAESIIRNKHVDIACFVGPDTSINESVAKYYERPLYNTIEESFNHTKVDGVIIASPNHLHLEHTQVCLSYKVPILLEKPLASDLKQGLEIVRLCREYSDKVLIGHHRAHSRILDKAKQLIDSNQLGKIVSFMGSAQFYKPESYFKTGEWRSRKGGGPILINMIHEVDTIRRLIGPISTITAVSTNCNRNFDVEDTVAISFSTENNILGTFMLSDTVVSSRSWELTSSENSAYPSFSHDCYWISGTEGSLAIPSMTIQRYNCNEDRSWWNKIEERRLHYELEDPIDLQLVHFCDVVNGISRPVVTPADAYANMCAVDAILKASTSNKKIQVNYHN